MQDMGTSPCIDMPFGDRQWVNVTKATGLDGIPAEVMKECINHAITHVVFQLPVSSI